MLMHRKTRVDNLEAVRAERIAHDSLSTIRSRHLEHSQKAIDSFRVRQPKDVLRVLNRARLNRNTAHVTTERTSTVPVERPRWEELLKFELLRGGR